MQNTSVVRDRAPGTRDFVPRWLASRQEREGAGGDRERDQSRNTQYAAPTHEIAQHAGGARAKQLPGQTRGDEAADGELSAAKRDPVADDGETGGYDARAAGAGQNSCTEQGR